MAKAKRTPAKKKPGRNVKNSERHTKMVLLRVSPIVAQCIAERAESLGVDKAQYVSQLVMADVAGLAGVNVNLLGGRKGP